MSTILTIVASGESGDAPERRVAAKLLCSSLLRSEPAAQVDIFRPAEAMQAGGLFKIPRSAITERLTGAPDAAPPGGSRHPHRIPALWSPALSQTFRGDGSADLPPWVLHLTNGSLVLRSLAHLFQTKADILWAPVTETAVLDDQVNLLLREDERAPGFRPAHPVSRPWRESASAAVWAVRGEHLATVLHDWDQLVECARSTGETDEGRLRTCAWNRLLIDTPLRVDRFEKDEVQFPGRPQSTFLRWKDAAIVETGDWPAEAALRFLQAWYFGTYFADPTGLFLDIVDP